MKGAGRGAPWALAVALGCGAAADGGPPDLRYGVDACDRCRMTIDDPRFAAAWRTASGDVRRYDDLGDLVAELPAGGAGGDEIWLHDYDDGSWIRAEGAVLVRSDLATPMGSGLVAFAGRAEAERFARDRGGRTLDWASLVERREAPSEDENLSNTLMEDDDHER